jgi:ATP-binding cassette, subfamily B, bacterial
MSTPSHTPEKTEKPIQKVNSLRGLLPFLKPHRAILLFWLIALGISASATLFFPVAFKYLIDRGFAKGGDINQWFLLMLCVAIVLAVATAARFYFISLLGERVIADLRQKLYQHLLQLDQSFFERTRSGELLSRLSADTELLRSMVGSSMSIALRSSITVIGSAIMLAVTSPRLAMYALLGIPLVVLPMALSGRRVRGAAKDSQDRVADANARAGETFNAMHTVQSYARENFESSRFSDAVIRSIQAARKRIALQATMTAVIIVIIFGAITAVLWLGARDLINGTMSAGTLTQFVFYAIMGAGSVGALTEVWNEVQRASGGMSRINDLFNEHSQLSLPSHPATFVMPARGALSMENIHFHYPSRPDTAALHNFSLSIAPGETVALVGPSGAGKTTVFQLLMRFHDPEKGSVKFDGVDVKQLEPNFLREHIALVPQDPVIFGTTARENIRYGKLDANDEAIETAARSAEAHDFISALPNGYNSELGERGARLSGGQQQRLAIARALLKDAPVLLLDEATSALDAQSERAVQQALERLMHGRTTLVIAHRLATVLKADRIVVMDKGNIVAQGTHSELIAQDGLYAELARLQFDH